MPGDQIEQVSSFIQLGQDYLGLGNDKLKSVEAGLEDPQEAIKEYDKAILAFKRSFSLVRDEKYYSEVKPIKEFLVKAYTSKAKVHEQQQDLITAKDCYLQAKSYCESPDALFDITSALEALKVSEDRAIPKTKIFIPTDKQLITNGEGSSSRKGGLEIYLEMHRVFQEPTPLANSSVAPVVEPNTLFSITPALEALKVSEDLVLPKYQASLPLTLVRHDSLRVAELMFYQYVTKPIGKLIAQYNNFLFYNNNNIIYAYCDGVRFDKIYLYIYDSFELLTLLNEHKFIWQLKVLKQIDDCFAFGDTCYIPRLCSWQNLNIENIKEYTQKDLQKIFNWATKAAEQNNSCAQYDLGFFYEHGKGAKKDLQKAIFWYRESAVKKNIAAQYRLALCYEIGDLTEKNLKQSIKWYWEAAKQGHKEAQYRLGFIYKNGLGVEKDLEKGFCFYKKAAAQGHYKAQYSLGFCYINGLGTQKDINKGVKLYIKSAKKGYIEAQYALGNCYKCGLGIKEDLNQAAFWYTQAAKHGHAEAQSSLAWCYERNKGVEENRKQAFFWYKVAANQGHVGAKNVLLKRFQLSCFSEERDRKEKEWYKDPDIKTRYEKKEKRRFGMLGYNP